MCTIEVWEICIIRRNDCIIKFIWGDSTFCICGNSFRWLEPFVKIIENDSSWDDSNYFIFMLFPKRAVKHYDFSYHFIRDNVTTTRHNKLVLSQIRKGILIIQKSITILPDMYPRDWGMGNRSSFNITDKWVR